MQLREAIFRRRTTNGPFLPRPVSEEHQRVLMEVAARAPSQLNSQPWRFVLIESRDTIEHIARISGESMTTTLAAGSFLERYRPYLRFRREEMQQRRDGMLFDRIPAPLRPLTGQLFTRHGRALMNALGVPRLLGSENRRLVAGSPLLLAVLLDRTEYPPGETSGFYSLFSMGAAMENVWLTTVELGMGIQFVSFPMEAPGAWQRIEQLLRVPPELALLAVYRLGYLPEQEQRPAIDWSSRERRRPSQYVFRESCETAQEGWDEPRAEPGLEPRREPFSPGTPP